MPSPIRLLPRTYPSLSRRIPIPAEQTAQCRHNSTTPNTPKLSKPSKYNPPSHPYNPKEKEHDNYYLGRSYNFPKDSPPPKPDGHYPHSLPPPGTWHHWFLTNKSLHFYLSLSILFGLTAFVSVSNFMKTSPFAHLVHWDWWHPIGSVAGYVDAYRMDAEERSRRALEKRKERLADFEKRGEYRRVHGLEKVGEEGGFSGWGLKRETGEAKKADNVDGGTGIGSA